MCSLYKLQLVNQINQEVLIEYDDQDKQFISNFIEICKETGGKECYIFDSMQRIYSGKFISCTMVPTEIEKIYQLFFIATLTSNIVL